MEKSAIVASPAFFANQKEFADLCVGVGQPEVVVDHLGVVRPEVEVVLNGVEVGRHGVPLLRRLVGNVSFVLWTML